MLPMPWQEVQICVHDVHETHFPLYYSSACSYINCADLKNVEFAGSIINKRCQNLIFLYPELMVQCTNKNKLFRLFYLFYSKCSSQKKKKLLWTGSVGKFKKKIFFFLGSGPKIGSVGTWETDNQLDMPLSFSALLFQDESFLKTHERYIRHNLLHLRKHVKSFNVNVLILHKTSYFTKKLKLEAT